MDCRCFISWSPGRRSRKEAGSCPKWTMRPVSCAIVTPMHLPMPMKLGESRHPVTLLIIFYTLLNISCLDTLPNLQGLCYYHLWHQIRTKQQSAQDEVDAEKGTTNKK